jgi:predicted transposase/invertase (TIGR01784 family)
MTRLEYTLTNDTLFKMLFVKYPKSLKHLVSNLLGISFESISGFEIRNPEIQPEHMGDKFCRLDITMTVNKQRVDIEVQVQNQGDYLERALYYWAREYSTALPEGAEYKVLPRTVVISIVDFKLFDCAEFHSEYRAFEVTRHTPLTDKFSLHFFELPKLPESVSADKGLELWLALFNAKTEEDLARIEELEVPIMNQTIEAYRNVAVSKDFQEAERMRSKARHDEAQALHHARQEGLQEGLQKGLKEGIQEGEYRGVASVARNALAMGMPIEDIEKLTGLTRKEIEKLRNSNN